MPTISTTVLNALAAAYFGRVAAQGPATLYAACVYDATDGITGGTEVAAAGNYSRTAIVNDQVKFSAPAAGVVKNALNIAGPRSTAAWHAAGHPINCVRFYDAAEAGNLPVPFKGSTQRIQRCQSGIHNFWADAVPQDQRCGNGF